jgi:hypothetical protein
LDEKASRNRRIQNALEACRADVRNADDAEFAFLASEMAANPNLTDRYERLQRLDARIALALQDVPVADDLADRVLARLAAEKPRPRVSRRWLLAGSGLLALAAGLLVAVWLGFHGGKPLSEQYVLDEAIRFFENSPAESQHWLSDMPPAEYPFSATIVQTRELRWQAITGFLGRRGVVYDLSAPSAGRATLFVVVCAAEGLGSAPMLQPFTTAGCSASAWREDGLLYILVVQGDPAVYQGHLRLPSGPIA